MMDTVSLDMMDTVTSYYSHLFGRRGFLVNVAQITVAQYLLVFKQKMGHAEINAMVLIFE